MSYFHKIILKTVFFAVLICTVLISQEKIPHLLGYYFTSDEKALALYLVNTGKDMSACNGLTYFEPLSPAPWEKRLDCKLEYVRIAQNPSLCEKLLPNEFGLACLNEVGGLFLGNIPCNQFDGENRLYCNAAYSEGELTIENPQINDCNLYSRKDVREWCYFKRSTMISDVHECSKIDHSHLRDQCEEGYALKQKDPTLCEAVEYNKNRTLCEIRINAWLDYPELRDSFYFKKPIPVGGFKTVEDYYKSTIK